MNTATGATASVPSPAVTVTVVGSGDSDAAEASTGVAMAAANATVTITSTYTDTHTITQSEIGPAAIVTASSESSFEVIASESANDCVPATVTLTITETVGSALSPQEISSPKEMTPLTTVVISELYSQGAEGGQTVLDSYAHSASMETGVTQEAVGTTTTTLFERPTVVITSTRFADIEMPSSLLTSTVSADTDHAPCEDDTAAVPPNMVTVSFSKVITEMFVTTLDGSEALTSDVYTTSTTEVVTVEKTMFATGTAKVLNQNSTSTALKTITLLPANTPTPEETQAASSNGTSSVIASEGIHLKQSAVAGCAVVVVAAILCMF